MSAPKWTPGPWHTRGDDVWADGPDGDDLVICAIGEAWGGRSAAYSVVRRHRKDPNQEAAANAHLIAAAPELYAGLEKAFNAIRAIDVDALGVVPETHDCPSFPIRDQLLHELARVMRKARGEQR